MSASMSTSDIRRKVKEDLPHIFEPQPQRAWLIIPIVASEIVGIGAMLTLELAWYYNLLIALLVGNSFGMGIFLAHETIHGATIKHPFWRMAVGYLGFGPFIMSPHLWFV